MSSNGSNLHPLLPGWHTSGGECCGRWTPDGKFFVFTSNESPTAASQIWVLDERSGLLRRPPAEPLQLTTGPTSWGAPLPGEDGKKLFACGSTLRGELSRIDPATKEIKPFLAGISADNVSFSRDGQFEAYVSFPEGVLDGYLQGRYLLSKRDFEGAVRMFRRAVVLDPGYARSWAGLAAGLAELAMWTDPVQGLIPEAKAAARHAIELDPGNGEAWSVLGQIAFNQERDWKAAEYDLQRAIALSPGDSTTESRYAIFLSIVGRRDEAVTHMRRALELDPLSFFNVRLMGSVFYWSRRYDESLEYIRKAEEMEPELAVVTVDWEVENYVMKGMEEQAVMADLRNFPLPGGKRWRDRLDAAYRSGGRKAYWETRVKFDQAKPGSPCRGLETARIYVFAGENDRALEDLNGALNEGCSFLSMMRTEPLFDPLRGDPRFKDMLKKVNLSD
jgi:tetratricopeptide (TPR) repeat protein